MAFADYLASNLPYGEQRKLEIARALGYRTKASAVWMSLQQV